ncbi:hypothetical protein E2E30_04290 [Sphingomonas sp. AAP5]|nr:hypothetical protein E2E30_04290 [Sphingomonas sp. AAP5]
MLQHQAATTVPDPARVSEGVTSIRLANIDDLLLTLLAKRLARALMLDQDRSDEPLNVENSD